MTAITPTTADFRAALRVLEWITGIHARMAVEIPDSTEYSRRQIDVLGAAALQVKLVAPEGEQE